MKRTTFLAASAATAVLAAVPRLVRASADAVLTTPTGKIFGTLEFPAAAPGAVPVVLIIAGSGPTDRDGNSTMLPGKNDALKQIALGLAGRGIASLRYDKRAIGASAAAAAAESDLRFDMYVEDAVGWIAQLRTQPRFSRVVVAGHSEGSLVGMLAAARAKADGFVSLEGAGRPAAALLREQFARFGSAAPAIADEAWHIVDELAAGRTVADISPPLASAFRPSVQQYIISWFKYDPAHEIAAIKAPVAIVQGTADAQVRLADAQALHAGAPSARYVVVDGMNHVLKHVPNPTPDAPPDAKVIAGYTDPSLQVEAVVIDTIAMLAKG